MLVNILGAYSLLSQAVDKSTNNVREEKELRKMRSRKLKPGIKSSCKQKDNLSRKESTT